MAGKISLHLIRHVVAHACWDVECSTLLCELLSPTYVTTMCPNRTILTSKGVPRHAEQTPQASPDQLVWRWCTRDQERLIPYSLPSCRELPARNSRRHQCSQRGG